MSTVRLGPMCGKPLVLQVLRGEPLECRKPEGHTGECSAMVSGSYDMALCGALNPQTTDAVGCWWSPDHAGPHSWAQCRNRGGTSVGSGILCELERGHDGPHRMEW